MVVGILRNGPGETVWLRADMDGLPMAEATGLPYASNEYGVDPSGERVPIAHACGHDMHVTCLIGATTVLAATKADWSGTVVAIFQPAEETLEGARGMLDDGLASRVPTPRWCWDSMWHRFRQESCSTARARSSPPPTISRSFSTARVDASRRRRPSIRS